jgi:hypothetical protein
MKPIWTCSITGKKGLTLEEALDSEKKEMERLSAFSESHLELICRMVHGCMAFRSFPPCPSSSSPSHTAM